MPEGRYEEARVLAQELLGAVDEVVHQPYGGAGITFEIRSPSGDFILKTKDQAGAFDHTERHFKVLKDLGIHTQSVLRRGSHAGFAYLLLTKIPGHDLGTVLGEMNRDQMSGLAGQIVQIERKVTALPKGEGFGWTPMAVPGPFPSWRSVIERDSRTCPEEVRKQLLSWTDYFDSVEPVCFLDDLTVKNVIVQDGTFQGIVDLDEVCYGDPLYWLSLAEVTTILDVGLQGAFYGDELRRLWGMDEQSMAACDLYNVVQAWFFLGNGTGHDLLKLWANERFERFQSCGIKA